MSDNRDISPEKYLKDPFKKYYEEHPDQLSYKIKDQYDCATENKIFVVFFIVIVAIALLVGICL